MLSEDAIQKINPNGFWNVTDDVLEMYELQEIIDCSKEGDTIALNLNTAHKPSSSIMISRPLTIGFENSSLMAELECPSKSPLFQIKSV